MKRAKYRHAYDTMCADLDDGDEIAPAGKPCIIKNYDDGYFWFSRGGASCEIFGEEGRNCGVVVTLLSTFNERSNEVTKQSGHGLLV